MLSKTVLLFFFFLWNLPLTLFSEEIQTIQAEEIWSMENTGVKPFLSSDGSTVAWEKDKKVFIAKVETKEVTGLGNSKELLGWFPENNEYLMVAEGFLSTKTKQLVSSLNNAKDKSYIIKLTTLDSYSPYTSNPSTQLKPIWIILNGNIKKVFSTGEPFNFSFFQNRQNTKIILFSNGVPLVEKDSKAMYEFLPSPHQDKFMLYFSNPQFSPEETKDHIVLITQTNNIWELPYGSDFSWSPDGKFLIFARVDEDNDDNLVSGELYICDSSGRNIKNIRFQKTMIRDRPSFGSSNIIAYHFYDKNFQHCIGVAKLHF